MLTKKSENLSAVSTRSKQSSFKRRKLGKLLLLLLIIVAIGGAAVSAYYYKQYQSLKINPNIEAQKETASLVSMVGKLMELPADETPTVATVADKDKLKDQTFFVKAENGDKLLAFTKSMQAILYRPSTNKIIAVVPIVINNNEKTTPTSQLENSNSEN